MTYEQLKEIMHEYRQGRLSRDEMALAIGLWQRSYAQVMRINHSYKPFLKLDKNARH